MADQNSLKLGDWNAICDVCGFKFKASKLQKRWDGAMVCKDDFEHRHPMDFFRGRKEDTSVPWSRPENTSGECSSPSSVPGVATPGCAIPGFNKGFTNPL